MLFRSLREMLAFKKVPVHLETSLQEIKENAVTVTNKEGESYDLPCDSVIMAIGYDSTPLEKSSKNVHIVGDAYQVGNLRTVIWRAWDVCMKL